MVDSCFQRLESTQEIQIIMKVSHIVFVVFTSVFLVDCSTMGEVYAKRVFYVDKLTGSDANAGTSSASAWKTLEKVNAQIFEPGDQILFKAGGEWHGTLSPKGSGEEGKPILISSYGEGAKPVIHGNGEVNCNTAGTKEHYCTIYLNNQEYWSISNLEVTNFDKTEENNISLQQWEQANVTDWAEVLHPPQYKEKRKRKSAILVQARNMGAIRNLSFENLHIHGVNGDITDKNNGGLFFEIRGKKDERPTYFDNLLIENCHIHDVDRTGISNVSYYQKRGADSSINWVPSINYVVRNNTFERVGANALIARVSVKALIEHNLFDHCGIKESGNAVFNFNTDSTLMQYNESRYTKYNVGDHDAGGMDSDFRTKWTILQYNYIHDNDFGPLVTGGQRNSGGFNIGTIVRFNIFENDGIMRDTADRRIDYSFKISGNATDTWVHNNLFRLGSEQNDRAFIYHKNWGAYPDGATYFNNVFVNGAEGTRLELTKSTNTRFMNNIVAQQAIANWTEDVILYELSDLFQSDTSYIINEKSPLSNTGIDLIGMPAFNYYQQKIDVAQVNIGID